MAVSFQNDILPLFTQTDIQHMQGMGVQLSDYNYMSNPAGGSVMLCGPFPDHGNASAVFAALTGKCQPQMPMGTRPKRTRTALRSRGMRMCQRSRRRGQGKAARATAIARASPCRGRRA